MRANSGRQEIQRKSSWETDFGAGHLLMPSQPYGAVLPGATFKFSTLTASGQRIPSQGELYVTCPSERRADRTLVSQLSQTSYLALQTPYSYFGLGRINNYVEVSAVRPDINEFKLTYIIGRICLSERVYIPKYIIPTSKG